MDYVNPLEKKVHSWHLDQVADGTEMKKPTTDTGRKMKRKTISTTGLAMALCVLAMVSAATAAEISIPPVKARPGDVITFPVMLDRVDNLAGVKLVMTYDPDILTFSKAEKTRFTHSMMHIVNDKKPGTLIAVMAAARGVKGEEFPLLIMEFRVNASVKSPMDAGIEIREAQLMSDDLKDIPYTVKTPPIKILGGAPPEIPEKKAEKAQPPGKGEGDDACGDE